MGLVQQYLSNRKQKVDNWHSSWKESVTVFLRVQSLVHLFSTSFYVAFHFLDGATVASYADNTTPYRFKKFGNKRNRALFRIWINSDKSYILFSVHDVGNVNIDNNAVTFEIKNELIGTVLELSFEDHIFCICKKASQTINALAKIAPYICLVKRKTVMKTFETSQFGSVF